MNKSIKLNLEKGEKKLN